MPELKDTDPMPFGNVHKGKPTQDVPAAYFHWYWTQTSRPNAEVNDYIQSNLDALKLEYQDGIWE